MAEGSDEYFQLFRAKKKPVVLCYIAPCAFMVNVEYQNDEDKNQYPEK